MGDWGLDKDGRTVWTGEDIEREIHEGIKRRMAEREEHIRRSDDDYKKHCEAVEFQIESYVNPRYNKDVTALYGILAILVAGYYLLPPYSIWWVTVIVATSAVVPILNWREQRRMCKLILRMRKQCVEPTFRERELALFAQHDLTFLDEMRDENRRMLRA
jgi:hypothetical protein